MNRFFLRSLLLGIVGFFGYSTAIACSCIGGGWQPGDLAVTGEVSGARGGCGSSVSRKLTVTEVHQDPSGTVAVGDKLALEVNESSESSCGIRISGGDTLTVWSPGWDLHAGLCNSFTD